MSELDDLAPQPDGTLPEITPDRLVGFVKQQQAGRSKALCALYYETNAGSRGSAELNNLACRFRAQNGVLLPFLRALQLLGYASSVNDAMWSITREGLREAERLVSSPG